MNGDKQIVLRGVGTDRLFNAINDGYIRLLLVKGELYASPIDIIECFRDDIENPRQFWKDQKKRLLSKDWNAKRSKLEYDPELVANLYRLKIPAADGKKYLTDLVPLWVGVYIAGRLNQEFYKAMSKYTAAGLKYHMMNVARGLEWASETIRAELEASLTPSIL